MSNQPRFPFDANRLCLDFVNTEVNRGGRLVDLLASFEDLVDWLKEAEVLGEDDAAESIARWAGDEEAREVLLQGRELRSDVRAVVDAKVAGRRVEAQRLRLLNLLLQRRIEVPYLAPSDEGTRVGSRRELREPLDLLVPIAESTAAVVLHDRSKSLGVCDSPDCVLVYYDTSKNRSRRWCSMQRCGNRSKVAAHARRHGASSSA